MTSFRTGSDYLLVTDESTAVDGIAGLYSFKVNPDGTFTQVADIYETNGIRPEQISDEISRGLAREGHVKRRAKVEVVHPTGPDTLILIELNETPVTCRVHPETMVRSGQMTELMFDLSKLVFFDPETERRIR